MKYLFIAIIALCSPIAAFCQDITGLWTGTLYNDDTQQSLPYEIFIKKDNGKLTGYSQTWFLMGDKKYYGVKKIKIHQAKDGKIIIQDAGIVENHYPSEPNKDMIQLNILDLATIENEATLKGPYVTNRTKAFGSLSGRINIKRVATSDQSSLIDYLHKNNIESDIANAIVK